jgi:hypothetical protein
MEGLTLRAPEASSGKASFDPMPAAGAQPVLVSINAGQRATLRLKAHDAKGVEGAAGAAAEEQQPPASAADDEEARRKKEKRRKLAFFLCCCCALAAAALIGGVLGGLGVGKAADTPAAGRVIPRLAVSVFFTLPFVGGTAGDVLRAPGAGGEAVGVVS